MLVKTSQYQFTNLSSDELIEEAITRKEGVYCVNGALSVETGYRTGRSPKDRFIVRDNITSDTVDWGLINQPITPAVFQKLWQKANDFIADKDIFISDLKVGADEKDFLPVKTITEYAWHQLFVRNLFIRSSNQNFAKNRPEWILLSVPGCLLNGQVDGVNSDSAVILNFTERKVLICGMRYAGEMKKAMFSVMNFLAPESDILPMHCSANVGEKKDVALFFGLSGTGKTTLSADPKRYLIGDDEHGWSKTGVFNFEGGCYAKCIHLSKENEPFIYNAIRQGAVMENVVLDANSNPNFDDDSLTENTRAAYPREFIDKCALDNRAGHPRAVIFLTCDMYGVLPPVTLLSKEQAAYYFLSGYTAKVGSTEVGSASRIAPTFSECFGAPFFPRPAQVYADLLMKRIKETGAQVYLVNTGWTGGTQAEGGHRFSIPTTRAVVDAILNDELKNTSLQTMPGFGFKIPTHISSVQDKILNPRNAWSNQTAFDIKANELMQKFVKNFKRFKVSQNIVSAGPQLT